METPKSIATSIILTISVMILCVVAILALQKMPYTYSGEREFYSIEELEAFKKELSILEEEEQIEVQKLEADLREVPIKAEYVFYDPNLADLYGSPLMGKLTTVIFQVVLASLLIVLVVLQIRTLARRESQEEL